MEKTEISFAKGFYIDPNGQVTDTEGEIRNIYRNGDGYLGVSIRVENGGWVTMGLHRLLAITFIPQDREDRIHVNHIDGNVSNYALDNLEWVTVSENNIHSTLLRPDNKFGKLKCVNVKTGEIHSARNLHEASTICGLDYRDIWKAVKDNLIVDNWEFSYHGKVIIGYTGRGRSPIINELGQYAERSIRTRDIVTGEIRQYRSIAEAARTLGVSSSLIHHAIPKSDTTRFLLKQYQVAYHDEEFRNLTKEDVELAMSYGSKEVMAYNVVNKTFEFYESARQFHLTNGLSKKAVTVALKKNSMKQISNWIAVYKTEENYLELKNHLNGSSL